MGPKPKLSYLQSEIHLNKTRRRKLPVGRTAKRDLVKSSLPSCQKKTLPVAAARLCQGKRKLLLLLLLRMV